MSRFAVLLQVTPDGYAWMTERLLRHAGGRLVLALEGGYNTRWAGVFGCVLTRVQRKGTEVDGQAGAGADGRVQHEVGLRV